MPRLQALRDEFGTDELEVIAINRHDPADAIRRMATENGFTFRIGVDGEASGVARRYDVRCYPVTFVLDRDTQVAAVIVGQNDERLSAALAAVGCSAEEDS